MEKYKIRTYSFYAVGEILLVVIGILLAIQIDSWNQKRLDKDLEENYMKLLKQEIQANADFIQQFYVDRYDRKVAALETMREYYQGNYQIQDSLEFAALLGYGAVFSTQAIGTESKVFEEIISTGNLNVLDNEELRRSLLEYYGFMEAYRQGLTFYTSGYLSAVNSYRPFNGASPDHIDKFDASLSIRKAGTEEFYKLTNAELSYAHQAMFFMGQLKSLAEKIIVQIDTNLEKF